MSPIKSRLGNVSPQPQSSLYEELQIRSRRELVEEVRNKVNGWPRKLQDLFNNIHDNVNEENELLKMFEALVEVKRDLAEEAIDLQKHEEKILKCIKYLCMNAPYFQKEFEAIFRHHDQDLETFSNFFDFEYDFQPECADVSDFRKHYQPECAEGCNTSSKNQVNYCWIIGAIFGVFIVAISVVISMDWSTYTPDITEKPNKIEEWTQNMKELQAKFPSQNEKIWVNIMSGVKTIVTEKPTKPSVFLLLHNDKKTSACLANKVGKEAVKLLSDSSQEPILIKGEDLKLNESLAKDYGLFTESYKHDIEEKHVMIVLDLQEVPGMVARTFHVLCDVENPLVRDAAFLFTMQVDEKPKLKPTQIAEDYLSQLWKNSLPTDIMEPLITRITDAVVSVKMESSLPC